MNRLDLGTSGISYQRMREAINSFAFDPGNIEKDPFNNHEKKEYLLQGTWLRDILLKSFAVPEELQPETRHLQDPEEQHYVARDQLDHESRLDSQVAGAFSQDQLIQSWARRYRNPNPVVVEGDPILEGLNTSQIRAVAMMIGERICLIQGPPGTGKTKTIVETIKLLKGHFDVPHPLLVCTYTNVAVDNLLEGFVAGGLSPLRVGSSGDTKDNFEEYTFDYQYLTHPVKSNEIDPLVEEARKLDKRILELKSGMKEVHAAKNKNWFEKLGESANVYQAFILLSCPSNLSSANMKKHLEQMKNRSVSLKVRARAIRHRVYSDICRKADVVNSLCILMNDSVLSFFPTDLYDMHKICFAVSPRYRFSCGLPRRSIDVNRAGFPHSTHERSMFDLI